MVDDETWRHEDWKETLGDRVIVLSAFTIAQAEELFMSNQDIVAITMDACVPGDEPTTPPLVKKFRETFTGPMIAASSFPSFRDELMEAGCDHESPKDYLLEKLLEVLGL